MLDGGMGMGCRWMWEGTVGGRLQEVDGYKKLTVTETWMVFTGWANAMCNKVWITVR